MTGVNMIFVDLDRALVRVRVSGCAATGLETPGPGIWMIFIDLPRALVTWDSTMMSELVDWLGSFLTVTCLVDDLLASAAAVGWSWAM